MMSQQELPPYPIIDVGRTGCNIRELRKVNSLTVRQIQQYFGFSSVQSVYNWERGRSLPTLENMYALSVLLGETMESILEKKTENV